MASKSLECVLLMGIQISSYSADNGPIFVQISDRFLGGNFPCRKFEGDLFFLPQRKLKIGQVDGNQNIYIWKTANILNNKGLPSNEPQS